MRNATTPKYNEKGGSSPMGGNVKSSNFDSQINISSNMYSDKNQTGASVDFQILPKITPMKSSRTRYQDNSNIESLKLN
jgi:hypothetical protein